VVQILRFAQDDNRRIVESEKGQSVSDERRQARWLMGMALVAWAAVSLPLLTGSRTLYQRDVLSVHAPWKAFGAEALRHGSVPAFNPTWALGQPFRGNPNALPLYPGNLLYLALPFWIAFNLHYVLHWLLALFTFRALARALGMGESAAALAAFTYAGSGYVLSCLSFYNLIAVAAWWPLAMWGAVRGGRRGIAIGGLACGLAFYAGEPLTVALAAVPLVLAAAGERGARRGLAAAAAIGALGVVIALPQIVAVARVAPFTYRGGHGALPSEAVTYTLHPLRWLELVIPLPFGDPSRDGLGGWWATSISPNLPLFFSLYAGCVALWLATLAGKRRLPWALLAASGWALAWLLGLSGESLVRFTAGLFRFPEKLLVWPAIALPLLAGWGFEEVARAGRGARRALVAAAGLAVLAALVLVARPALAAAIEGQGGVEGPRASRLLAHIAGGWTRDLAVAAALLAAAGWAARRRQGFAVAALQLAALLQLRPLASTAPLREILAEPVPWAAQTPPGTALVNEALVHPRWNANGFTVGDEPAWTKRRIERQQLSPWTGVASGLTYPLAPDIEGAQSPLLSLVEFNLPKLDMTQRTRWLRVLGVDRLARLEPVEGAGLRELAGAEWSGTRSWLYAVEDSQPKASWPAQVGVASSPVEVLRAVSFGEGDPVTHVLAAEAVEHRAGGSVEVVRDDPDGIELRTHGPGGLVVLRRAYQPLYRARAGRAVLRTLPVNLTLLGVVVPAGEARIEIDVPAAPELIAAGAALVAVTAALAFAWRPARV
jgi:hypothetical protein